MLNGHSQEGGKANPKNREERIGGTVLYEHVSMRYNTETVNIYISLQFYEMHLNKTFNLTTKYILE